MFYGLLDPDGRFEFVRAGHPTPLLLRRGAVSELYSGGSFPVGLIDVASFNTAHIQLEPEDTLLLYTDGITEAEDRDGNQFGGARLAEAFGRHQDSSLSNIEAGVLSAVERFCEGTSQADDITLLVVRFRRPTDGAGKTDGSPAGGQSPV
jgi:sigma-B regulation protein RsbU (phosphoserine phosphatase)